MTSVSIKKIAQSAFLLLLAGSHPKHERPDRAGFTATRRSCYLARREKSVLPLSGLFNKPQNRLILFVKRMVVLWRWHIA